MTGMLKLMTAAEGLGMMMKCVALPWASLELLADAALEPRELGELALGALRRTGAARGLFGR